MICNVGFSHIYAGGPSTLDRVLSTSLNSKFFKIIDDFKLGSPPSFHPNSILIINVTTYLVR